MFNVEEFVTCKFYNNDFVFVISDISNNILNKIKYGSKALGGI